MVRRLSPSKILVLSFACVIVLGSILLYMPFCRKAPSMAYIDALFTATSAVCVTGLTVIDLGKDLSFWGQLITFFLFEVGGLGIVTFSVFIFYLIGKSPSFATREVIQRALLPKPRRDFRMILTAVMRYSAFIQLLGAAFLFFVFLKDFEMNQVIFMSIYHAGSAFNNCGFSLFPDSFVRYVDNLGLNLIIMGLIVAGGLGFFTLKEIASKIRGQTFRLSLHTKLVLITTSVLILGGALLFYVFERNNVLRGVGLGTSILASLFQSVTSRTAGFNTVDISKLTNQSLFFLMILMFIGASPGSTGGGIKTTTFAVLFLLVFSRLKGKERVDIFNRTIPEDCVKKAISVTLISWVFIVMILSLILFSTPETDPSLSRHLFIEYFFETISAFGTVGLSTGITPSLGPFQKFMIILMMFAGRVGPLTLAYALTMKEKKVAYTYAEENIMIG
jgi:trk system potassium uptake protein TrkH